MTTPAGIFISYRREDAAWPAGWLHDTLTARLGPGRVFMDVDSIQPGDDFYAAITTAVTACHVLVAVIGPRWHTGPAATIAWMTPVTSSAWRSRPP